MAAQGVAPQQRKDYAENKLRERLRAAEKAYWTAAELHARLRLESARARFDPRAAFETYLADRNERRELGNYLQALHSLADLVINGRMPQD